MKNLRAAGTAEISRRRRTTPVVARELTSEEAAPLLKDALSGVGPIARRVIGRHFAVSLDASLSEWIEAAVNHPMFILEVMTH